jgi:ABC-type dipeptide/oligopeptide/nickel transport system permease subunit
MSSYLDASLDATIRFSVEVFVLIFSISLIICLIVQIKRGKEDFDSGFFHIFILLAICDSIGNFMVNLEKNG